jgi:hypothetical protein
MSDDSELDSIRAAERLMRSSRLRGFLAAVWPFVYPVLCAAAGWLVHLVQAGHEIAAVRLSLTQIATDVSAIRADVSQNKIECQQASLDIGMQAAYATAGFMAGEPSKARAQKIAEAEKYAAAYERILRVDKAPPRIAYSWLWQRTSIP